MRRILALAILATFSAAPALADDIEGVEIAPEVDAPYALAREVGVVEVVAFAPSSLTTLEGGPEFIKPAGYADRPEISRPA